MSKTLVVVGATGSQGRAVINYFQSHEPSWSIRGLTRNPASDAAVKIARSGVEVVKADLNDVASLTTAFECANYIFAYTDFAGIIRSSEVMGKFQAGELQAPVGAAGYNIELQQGRNIADAASSVLELERLVWSALPGVRRLSKGKYEQVYHFDAKADAFEYMLSVEALREKTSAVHLGAFMTNAISGLDLFKLQKLDDCTVLWKPPFPLGTQMPYIDVERDIGSFVKALIDAPAPTQVLALSKWATPTEWLALWSQVTLAQADAEEFKGNDSTGFMRSVFETGQFVSEFGFTGSDERILMPGDLKKQGFVVTQTSLSDYMSRENWSSISK